MGMLSPDLPLVDAVLNKNMAMRQSYLGDFVKKQGIANNDFALIEQCDLTIKLPFLLVGEVESTLKNHNFGLIIELCLGKKLGSFCIGAVLECIGFYGVFGSGEDHVVFKKQGFLVWVVAA